MRRRSLIAGASALVACSLAACAAMSGLGNAPGKEVMPAVQLVGHDSKIAEPRFVLIKDEEAWINLWSEHLGVAASHTPPTRHVVPKVDFARYIVVGSFHGAGTNTDGEVVQSVLVGDDAVRIRFESSSFQSAGLGPGGDPGVKTTSFGLWVIEKTDKPIVIEQPGPRLKADPVNWVEAKRFEAR